MAQAVGCSRWNPVSVLSHRLALFGLLSLITIRAFAGSATLAWEPVSSPALAGYMLYYGAAAGNYANKIDVGNTNQRTVCLLYTSDAADE